MKGRSSNVLSTESVADHTVKKISPKHMKKNVSVDFAVCILNVLFCSIESSMLGFIMDLS